MHILAALAGGCIAIYLLAATSGRLLNSLEKGLLLAVQCVHICALSQHFNGCIHYQLLLSACLSPLVQGKNVSLFTAPTFCTHKKQLLFFI